jgi:hypothetical protein
MAWQSIFSEMKKSENLKEALGCFFGPPKTKIKET